MQFLQNFARETKSAAISDEEQAILNSMKSKAKHRSGQFQLTKYHLWCHPDMTFTVDWALKNNYLSIYLLWHNWTKLNTENPNPNTENRLHTETHETTLKTEKQKKLNTETQYQSEDNNNNNNNEEL